MPLSQLCSAWGWRFAPKLSAPPVPSKFVDSVQCSGREGINVDKEIRPAGHQYLLYYKLVREEINKE